MKSLFLILLLPLLLGPIKINPDKSPQEPPPHSHNFSWVQTGTKTEVCGSVCASWTAAGCILWVEKTMEIITETETCSCGVTRGSREKKGECKAP